MPINVGYFRIRQPRVSPINAIVTTAPTSFGTFSLLDGFEISYTGSAVTCYLYVTGTRILTLCDDIHNHPDNINISLAGRKIGEVSNLINSLPSYTSSLITTRENDDAYLEGLDKYDLKAANYLVKYNNQKEYMIDVHTRGELSDESSKISTKTEEFTYRGEISRWNIDEGKIHDVIGLTVPSNGEVPIGSEGVWFKFAPSFDPQAIDLENIVNFNDEELVYRLDQPISSSIFPVAPILIDGTLDFYINQELKTEGKDYLIDYGDKPAILSPNHGPYIFTSSNNVLKVRWNSDDVQELTITPGAYIADQLVTIINSTFANIYAQTYIDEQNRRFLTLVGKRGTITHQLRIEDGSANAVFGFDDFQSKKGSGVGQVHFMTYIDNEIVPHEVITDSLQVSAITTATENPFLGIDTSNFELYEDDVLKTRELNYLVDGGGNISLITRIPSENLVQKVLKLDNDLFEPSYIIFKNGEELDASEYTINPQGGWITLEESAFPGDVFSASYTNNILGKIENEIIIGSQAMLRGTKDGPFAITSTTNTFKVFVDNLPEQTFTFIINSGTSPNNAANLINATAVGFKCLVCGNKLELQTNNYGPYSTIRIGNGTANTALGFENNQSVSGKGAEGGERSLEVKNAPMDIIGFNAPIGGNTILIKNNDVTARYPSGALIKIFSDIYQIEKSTLEDKANIINSVSGPYTIILGTNDTFKFTINSEEEKTVTFNSGSQITLSNIVSQINTVRPQTAKVYNFNGVDRIQILGSSNVKIGNGSANRTLGFNENDEDSSSPDTFIKITGSFKNTYVAPPLATTTLPIVFLEENALRIPNPQNTTEIYIEGDQTSKYKNNVIIRLGGNFYYKILNSIYEDGSTKITIDSKTDIPVFTDTPVAFSEVPVYEEGETLIKTSNYLNLTEPTVLKKNGNILTQDIDYSISETGDIELTAGLIFGDEYLIEYTARRYISTDVEVAANYSYFDFLNIGTNIRFSAQGINPDNFYVNVLHGSTLLNRTQTELESQIISNLGSGSSGFPSGSIPTTENDESGSANNNYVIGDLNNKIELAQKIFEFYDYRLSNFEYEKNKINGWVVGAEDGRVTLQQIIDSATQLPPQRLFPDMDSSQSGYQDTRPIDQRTEPVRIPALDGLNTNDEGSPANGISPSYLILELNNELTKLEEEKTKLNTLKTYSNTSDSLTSTGPISSLNGGETIVLYAERNAGGTLVQRQFTVVLPGPTQDMFGNDIPPSGANVAASINSYANSAFGTSGLVLAVGSGTCTIQANLSNFICCYVVQDHAKVGFGTGNESSIRSRHTLYTGGSSYTIPVPGSTSVHININQHDNLRTLEDNLHTDQIYYLEGQMEEWLNAYVQSFTEAKSERNRSNVSKNESIAFTSLSDTFSSIKYGAGTFNSINNVSVIDDRIAEIEDRKLEVNRRLTELSSRLTEITSSLNRESLYNPRFSWVVFLADKSTGLYASKEREIMEQQRKLRSATNNLEALSDFNNLF